VGHPLDNPVWNALGGAHFRLGATDGKVRYYDPTITIFAGVEDPATADFAGLPRGRSHALVTAEPVAFPASIEVERRVDLLQMIAAEPVPVAPGDAPVPLGDANVPEMLALVALTEPGPFARRTLKMGKFWGIFEDGRLAAMAGERMRPPGFTEVSAVCTHPDYRGRGLSRRLISKVLLGIIERGETPFLHVFPDNRGAISVYESLGFTPRRTMSLALVHRR
jgi:predicted GNAT family acetyltransferase